MSVVEQETPLTIETASEEEEYRRDAFLRAAEIIETSGWRTGSKGMWIDGPKCILGSIGAAIGAPTKQACESMGRVDYYDYDAIQDFLGDQGDTEDMYRWNDGRGREQENPDGSCVAQVLRRMADGLKFKNATQG